MAAERRLLTSRRLAGIGVLWLAVVVLACARKPEPFPAGVVARYDGGVITGAEVGERFTREQTGSGANTGSPDQPTEKEERRRIAKRLVAERTWAEAMTPQRVAAQPGLQQRLHQLRSDLLLSFALSRGLGLPQLVREEEARQRYDAADPKELQLATTYTLRHLFVSVAAGSSTEVWTAARRKAEAARARMGAPGADLDRIIATTSDSEDAASGGWIRRLQLGTVEGLSGAFEEAVSKLSPGELSDPVRTRRGYQVILLVRRTPGRTLAFAEMREQIATRILEEKREQRLSEIRRQRETEDPLRFDLEAFRSGDPNAVVLRGKSTAVKLAQLREEEPRATAILAQARDAASAQALIDGVIRNRYFLDHAKAHGLDRSPELEAQWQARRRELLAEQEERRLLELELAKVPLEELRRFFDSNRARFASARQLHLRGLFLRHASKDFYATYARAATLRQRLERGEALDELVATDADVKGPQGNGDFGWLSHEGLAARGRLFYDTLVKAPAGAWIGPVKWEQGYAVVRIEAIREPKIPSFEEAEARVRRAFARRRVPALRQALEDEVFRRRRGELNPALVPTAP